MFDYRQYMSAPQQMINSPTGGEKARDRINEDRRIAEADAKIAAETSRREAREDQIRAEDRSYYETKEANDRAYYEQKEAAEDARYEAQMSSYQSGYANQSSAAVDPQGSGSFSPSYSPSPTPSAMPAATSELKGRDKRAAARAEMSVSERRTAQAKSGLNMTDFKAGYQSLKNA